MTTKKMTKQTADMVKAINVYLNRNFVTEISDNVFATTAWALSEAGCYHGFNWFERDANQEPTIIAKDVDNADCLQFNIR